MITRWVKGSGAVVLAALMGCTGGQESNAADETRPSKNPPVASSGAVPQTEGDRSAEKALAEISDAIPVYGGARFRDDLTRRDEVMLKGQHGPQTEVYTLATNDSFPQVFHYYTTYLAQFRSFGPVNPYPPENKNWRTLEVQLNEAMQDSFIPGEAIPAGGKRVTLQIAETEAEPATVIRYIVTPAPVGTAQVMPPPAAPQPAGL